jgi:hypothetical protein
VKVTDPALLAQLDGGKVTDPAILQQLDGQQEEPGLFTRALRRLATPFDPEDAKRRQVAADERAAGGPAAGGAVFPLTKDSGDIRTGLQAALSGIGGYRGEDDSSETKDRLARFRKEHPVLSFALPIAASMGKPSALPAAAPAAETGAVTNALTNLSNKMGRRTLYGGAETLSTKFPVSDASINAAHEVGAFKPLGTTEHAADVLSDALEQAGSLKGEVVKAMEDAGVKGVDSANMAQYLRSKADWLRKNTAGTSLPDIYEKVASDIEGAGAGRLGVQQSENIKTSLQKQAKYGNPTDTLGNMERKKIASILRQGVEDATGADAATMGGAAADATSMLKPAKQTYALLAPAAAAAEKGFSQATKRNAFSLRDTLMAAPMLAAHGPLAAAEAGLATKALRTYGPSTAAWALRKAAGVTGGSDAAVQALVLRGIPQDLAEAIVQSQSE